MTTGRVLSFSPFPSGVGNCGADGCDHVSLDRPDGSGHTLNPREALLVVDGESLFPNSLQVPFEAWEPRVIVVGVNR